MSNDLKYGTLSMSQIGIGNKNVSRIYKGTDIIYDTYTILFKSARTANGTTPDPNDSTEYFTPFSVQIKKDAYFSSLSWVNAGVPSHCLLGEELHELTGFYTEDGNMQATSDKTVYALYYY